MAGGSHVPSPGKGAGDGSRHGLDGFLWLGALFAEEKGKIRTESKCSDSTFPGACCPVQLEQTAGLETPARQLDHVFTPCIIY